MPEGRGGIQVNFYFLTHKNLFSPGALAARRSFTTKSMSFTRRTFNNTPKNHTLMKNKFLLLTLLLALPVLWAGCDKLFTTPDAASIAQPDELPPITTTGEGVFACKINGVNWQRCRGGFFEPSSLKGEWHSVLKIFYLIAMRSCGDFDDSMSIHAAIDSVGVYPLERATYGNFDIECQDVADPYILLDGADNRVEILNLDTVKTIVSGTFQCTLVHEKCGDTLFITDGRFDF
jgi:hypothetical protein